MEKEDKQKPSAERRPYQPPRVEESASFEHLVLACNHINPLLCGGKPMTKS
jgi:hypothetical protein